MSAIFVSIVSSHANAESFSSGKAFATREESRFREMTGAITAW
jgi:hypothetical protein